MSENEAAEENGSDFTPITSQEALDRVVGSRIDGVKKKFADYAELKEKAEQFDAISEANKSEVQRLSDALAEATSELEAERDGRLRADVAAAKGVPASSLNGSTKEELEASADALIEWRGAAEPVKAPRKPARGMKSGTTGSDKVLDPKEATAQALSDFVKSRNI